MLIGRGGGGKPQPESGCPSASYKPPTTTGFMITGSASVTGNGGYPPGFHLHSASAARQSQYLLLTARRGENNDFLQSFQVIVAAKLTLAGVSTHQQKRTRCRRFAQHLTPLQHHRDFVVVCHLPILRKLAEQVR